jgi:hypothetical protein
MRSRLVALAILSGLGACALEPFPLPASPPQCTADAQCDDMNPCTVDTCVAGACSNTAALAGTVCGSAPFCEGPTTCDGQGACMNGAPVDVDDGNPCTTDACDPSSGAVTHTPIPLCWAPLGTVGAPLARSDHTAVWTGAQMIVFGGTVAGMPSATASGALYDPVTQMWKPTPTTGAPAPRSLHVAVWTGTKMIVWGGYGVSDYETGGGLYDPVLDAWTPMSTVGAPSGRTDCPAVWTGSVLVVWGGVSNGNPLGDGAAYDPVKDTWTALPSSGAPSPRYGHSAVMAGTQIIFWGGYDTVNWLATGQAYDPVAGAWLAATPTAGAPEYREGHGAVWTGSQMVIWGGADPNNYIATGGELDPVAGTWLTLATTSAPSPRVSPTALWTGSAMFVWGGCGGQMCDVLGDGALWTNGTSGGTWQPIPVSPVVAGRHAHAAVWTGTSALVWGGLTGTTPTNTGAMFSP